MILDENLFEIKEARGSKEGVKRGPYNKEKSKSKEDLYDELQDRLEKEFYFPGVAKGGDLKVNLIMKDENKAELKGKKPARLIASSMSKYRDIKDEKELDTAKKIAKEMGFKTELDKTKRVPTLIIKLEESLNEKKSNRLTYHEFVDYLDSIDNGYTGFAKVTGNKGSGYRYTLSSKLTREQHDYLAQYDNVDFGTAQYKYAPEIKYDTVILLDRMSKTSPMKEDYDEDFFYTYEAIRHGESDPNRKYSGDFEDEEEAVELAKDDGYDEVVRYTYDFISDNFDDYWGMPPRRTDTIWTKESGYLNEDIVKTSKGKWVNKGKEGTHGEFSTKKKAREQQKAMFASGWKSENLEESADRISIEHDFEDITNMSDARERLKKYNIDLVKKDNRNYVLRKDGKEYTFYVLSNPNEVRKDLVKAVYKLTESSKSFDNKIILDLTIFDDNKIFEKKFNTIEELDNYIREISGLDLKADNNSDTAFNKSVISRDYKGDYHYFNSKNGDKVGDVETYALLRTYIERYPDGYGVSYYDFGYISPYGWRQVDDRDIKVIDSSKSHKGHWREMELKEDTETNKEVSAIRRYMTKVGMKPRKSAKEMVDFLTKFKERRAEVGTGILKENIGSDIAEYQKWVDYDMKKYGRISSLTNHKIRKAGLKIVKDKYGDYEVIANEPIREDLEREFTIHYNREGFEFGGYGAVRVKATNEDEAKEKFYAEKKDDKITISSIRPTENEDIRKGIRLLETKKVEEDVSMSTASPEKSKINFNVTDNGDFTFTINGKEYKGHTDKPEDMSKDLKDFGFSLTEDVQVVDKNQTEIDKKVGLENLLNDLINDENEAINGYNSAIVNFELEGKSDLTDVFRDIIKDEQNHIGNLQKVLNEINPTTIANLEQGQQEAADTLNK